MARTPRKRGGKASKRGLSDEQIPVLNCCDRTRSTTDFVLEKADNAHIGAALKPLLASDVVLCTDSGKALGAAVREMGSPSPDQSGSGHSDGCQGLSRAKRQYL